MPRLVAGVGKRLLAQVANAVAFIFALALVKPVHNRIVFSTARHFCKGN
jgi:hypothetical protein